MFKCIDDNITEEEFRNTTDTFEDCIIKLESEVKDLDLSKDYYVNHSCIWNRAIRNLSPCNIICYNDKLALVKFKIGEQTSILNNLYRIEDLSIVDECFVICD